MDGYLICATPRSGSSLLCGLLESTGVAGRPESYFRVPDEPVWAARWGIVDPDGTYSDAEFLRHALAAGRTDNGVFAARVMWGTIDAVVDRIAAVFGTPFRTDLDALTRAFGRTRFVYLRRDDALAQAVSWSRAEQTDIWFERTADPHQFPARPPRFDRAQIDHLLRLINEHNDAWEAWFASNGVEPHLVRYEDLDRDPVGTTRAVLDDLGIEPPLGCNIEPRHCRLADELNGQWIARYRATR